MADGWESHLPSPLHDSFPVSLIQAALLFQSLKIDHLFSRFVAERANQHIIDVQRPRRGLSLDDPCAMPTRPTKIVGIQSLLSRELRNGGCDIEPAVWSFHICEIEPRITAQASGQYQLIFCTERILLRCLMR